ncbi:Hypothetical protein J6892_02810 [Nakaseomyces glabratus]
MLRATGSRSSSLLMRREIVTSSTLFNATRDYIDANAPHTSFGPAPPVETHTVVLENNMTNYEVVSFWTTTNEFGGVITTSSTRTYSAPPLTVTATTGEDYVESDWISFFITVDEKERLLPAALCSMLRVVSFWTTTNEFGGVITTSSTRTYSAPPLTVTATTGEDYVESDWISFFITVDEKERLLPAALCSMLRVVSFWTTTNEFGGVITTSSTRTYSAPPLTVTATTGEDYVESDWISFFITVDEKERLLPAALCSMLRVVSFWTTTNEFGGVITTSSTRTYSAPPLTVTATTGEDYVESDWISFFITVDEKERLLPAALCSMLRVVSFWTTTNEFGGVITTSSTRTYSAPPLTVTATTGEDYVESDWISFFITVDEKERLLPAALCSMLRVVSFWTTTNEFGGVITTSSTRTYSAPPLTVTATTGEDYVESDWISFFITVDEKERLLPAALCSMLRVVSFWTTTNEFGGVITTSSTRTYSAPPLTVTATTGEDYVESDWISFFITVDEKERLLPAALCSMLRVVSFWTTTNEFGGVITTSSTRTYSAPPLTVTATTGEDYVESDWISFFITVDEKERLLPAALCSMLRVVSFWTTTNEFGGVITTSSTRTYSAPPLTVTATTGEDYVESDWISFFITVDEKERLLPAALCSMLRVVSFWTTTNEFGGVITTSSTRTYSAPPLTVTATTGEDYVESDWISFFITVDEKERLLPAALCSMLRVVSFWTTTNEFGGVITTSSTRTYSAPPLTVTATTGEDYVESDWISFFITVDEKERLLPAALCSMLRVTTLMRMHHTLHLALHLQWRRTQLFLRTI